MKLSLPTKFSAFFDSDGHISDSRYKVPRGGRGSGKSYSVASIIIMLMCRPYVFNKNKKSLRIFCGREFGSSIDESVSVLLKKCARTLGVYNQFTFTATKISHNINGSSISFCGFARNVETFKSADDIDLLWIEEGDKLTKYSFEAVIDPTVRNDGSQVWITYNPIYDDDYVHQRFVINGDDDAISFQINWCDNPWFPAVLRKLRNAMYKTDPDLAAHVWEGQTRKNSNIQVFFNKWIVDDFEPDPQSWDGPYYGVDWGFSVDPTVITESWINDGKLYVYRSAGKIGLDLDKTAGFFIDNIGNNVKTSILRADCSRPETIAHVKKQLPRIVGCKKWTGSIEDGITFLRSFDKIVIHSSCAGVIDEARLYQYKTDKSGEPTNVIIDKNNHYWDSIRYALEPHIVKTRKKAFGVL